MKTAAVEPKPVPSPEAITGLTATIDSLIEDRLDRLPDGRALRDAMKYAALGPGKRVRPVLAMRCAEAAGGRHGLSPGAAHEAAQNAAVAVELLHAFSLVHDDLPALDDDDLRRGRPTLHVHAGEAMAVLAGDALLNASFLVLLRGESDAGVGGRLARELAEGTHGMVAGQVFDTLGGVPEEEAGGGDEAALRRIHELKTGALLRAACRMGAIAGLAAAGESGDGRTLDAITRYSEAVGLIFQIVDDLIDVEQSAEHTGKRTGKDEGAGKMTFPKVIGVEASRRELGRLEDEALESAASIGASAEPLVSIVRWLTVRTR
ncbi:MAG: polyprenyl synthetase family protein [Planctomycetota bacterium]